MFSQSNLEEPLPNVFYSFPHIPSLTPKLLNIFQTFSHIKIATKNDFTTPSLHTKTKTPLKLLEKTGIVYSITCTDGYRIYIAETSRSLSGILTSNRSEIRCHLKIDWPTFSDVYIFLHLERMYSKASSGKCFTLINKIIP